MNLGFAGNSCLSCSMVRLRASISSSICARPSFARLAMSCASTSAPRASSLDLNLE